MSAYSKVAMYCRLVWARATKWGLGGIACTGRLVIWLSASPKHAPTVRLTIGGKADPWYILQQYMYLRLLYDGTHVWGLRVSRRCLRWHAASATIGAVTQRRACLQGLTVLSAVRWSTVAAPAVEHVALVPGTAHHGSVAHEYQRAMTPIGGTWNLQVNANELYLYLCFP
jgi:hypothetical protein